MDHYYVEECGCGITHEYRYDYLANGTIILTGYQGDDDYPCILYIPASINSRPVKAIGVDAFARNDGIEYAILPDGLVDIVDCEKRNIQSLFFALGQQFFACEFVIYVYSAYVFTFKRIVSREGRAS